MARFGLFVLLMLGMNCPLFGEETPSVTASQSPTTTPASTASPAAPRSVRISFLPPPLEGKISLGIYDATGKLVRILHQQASLNDFTVGADALVTSWDGKDDQGQDLPAGKYHARGYLVGPLKVQDLGKEPAAAGSSDKAQIRLIPNPLVKTDRPTVDLAVGFGKQSSFLKTADDLPLYTLKEQVSGNHASILKNGEKALDVWQDEGSELDHLRVSNLDQIMAFDCGDFYLK